MKAMLTSAQNRSTRAVENCRFVGDFEMQGRETMCFAAFPKHDMAERRSESRRLRHTLWIISGEFDWTTDRPGQNQGATKPKNFIKSRCMNRGLERKLQAALSKHTVPLLECRYLQGLAWLGQRNSRGACASCRQFFSFSPNTRHGQERPS